MVELIPKQEISNSNCEKILENINTQYCSLYNSEMQLCGNGKQVFLLLLYKMTIHQSIQRFDLVELDKTQIKQMLKVYIKNSTDKFVENLLEGFEILLSNIK